MQALASKTCLLAKTTEAFGEAMNRINKDGKPGDEALLKTCSPCHAKASRDFVSHSTHLDTRCSAGPVPEKRIIKGRPCGIVVMWEPSEAR